ncbi:MAG TPA: hypothetical protein VF688_00770 [Allosphingosinicella sp.]|jgi:hypothetical protein
MSIAGLLLTLIAGTGPAQTPAAAEPPPVEDIVVTGTRGSGVPKVRPDAVEVLRDHCFEAARLTRRFHPPTPGSRWIELDEKERRQFQIEDADVPAYAMEDEARAQHLWLKFERLKHKSNTEEQRCTLLVIGGRDHKRFVDDMSNLFDGRGTQRHVGERDGSPALAGWEQWVWTGMPFRDSKSWKALDDPKRLEPGWLVVVDVQGFYNSHDYIFGDMKLRKGPGTAVTMLTFSLTTRPHRKTASKPPPATAASLSSAGVRSPR